LATVSQNNRLTLRAEVSEKYYSVLPSIRSANFRTPYDNSLYELSQLNGRIISYGKASDSESFYVPILFQFDNKGSIIPGSFVEVYLLSSPIGDVISVPNSALIEEQGQFSVYVRAHDDKYKKTAVKLGLNNGRDTQVLSGLKEGDEVVTEGAYQIKLASATSAIPAHTHSH
jgi:multidrug efflux pump subunit AcrA (membrane-fusion protein)